MYMITHTYTHIYISWRTHLREILSESRFLGDSVDFNVSLHFPTATTHPTDPNCGSHYHEVPGGAPFHHLAEAECFLAALRVNCNLYIPKLFRIAPMD